MKVVVHFSAFEQDTNIDSGDNNSLVVKELAIVNIDLDCSQSWLFKPPFPYSELSTSYKHNNDYLSLHEYGVQWSEGEVSYTELNNILLKYTQQCSAVYCYGAARQCFLESIIGKHVINIQEDLKCPHYSQLSYPSRSCAHYFHRFSFYRCSLKECWAYANFIKYYDLSLSIFNPKLKSQYFPTPINNVDGRITKDYTS